VLLCFSGEGRVGHAFAFVYLLYSFKEGCWISYLPEDISCVVCQVFYLHLYSLVLKWVVVELDGAGYTGRLGACSLSVS